MAVTLDGVTGPTSISPVCRYLCCSAAAAADQPRRDGRDRQLGASDVELGQRGPCPVIRRPVPPQVLVGRTLRRNLRRGRLRVHRAWTGGAHRLRVPCGRRQRHRAQSSVHARRCHHRRARYVPAGSYSPTAET